MNLGSQFATLGANALAFINNLGPNNRPKILKFGPKCFSVLTSGLKWALYWFSHVSNGYFFRYMMQYAETNNSLEGSELLSLVSSFIGFPCFMGSS